jgi:DNA-binding GntR family transcriptional regulator
VTVKAKSAKSRAKAGIRTGTLPAEDLMYRRIVEAIMEKGLRPGHKLAEAELAALFGLNRMRVRRVLARLAAENLVEQQLNRGTFVSRPSPADARQLYQARRMLEVGIVRALAVQTPRPPLARLRGFVADERRAYEQGGTGLMRLSADFHILLAELLGNRIALELLKPLVLRSCLIQALYERQAAPPCLVGEHAALIARLAARDPDGAERVLQAHFDHILRGLDLDGGSREAGLLRLLA